MELKILGCSGGEAEGERLTGLLVNGRIAIDAGSLTRGPRAVRSRSPSGTSSSPIPTWTTSARCRSSPRTSSGTWRSPWRSMPCPRRSTSCGATCSTTSSGPTFRVIPSPDKPDHPLLGDRPRARPTRSRGLRITPVMVNHLVPCVGYRVEDDHSAFIFTSRYGRDGRDLRAGQCHGQPEAVHHRGQLPQRAGLAGGGLQAPHARQAGAGAAEAEAGRARGRSTT